MSRKRIIIVVPVLLLLLLGFILFYMAQKGSKTLSVGDIAPDFMLNDADGRPVSLYSYTGQSAVVLYFYPKDETPGCTAQACSFRDNYEAFKNAGAEVIGISSDSGDSHRSFAGKHRLPFVLLSDPGGRVRKLYGVPELFFLLPGRVTFVIGKDGRILHIFNSMFRAEDHIPEALKALGAA